MGKNLVQQRRGRGTSTFKKTSFRWKGRAKLTGSGSYTVTDFIKCPIHTAPLAQIKYADGSEGLTLAHEGMCTGDSYSIGSKSIIPGHAVALRDIPEGTSIFNIEGVPGDGGKFVRASGMSARIVLRSADQVVVRLPSKKQKSFNPDCKAVIGLAAGGGRTEKPRMGAGRTFHRMKAKHTYWPITSGGSMNAVAHPMGNKRSSRKSKARPAPKNAPPGRMVGMIRPRRTGRKQR